VLVHVEQVPSGGLKYGDICLQLVNVGEDVLLFYNDKQSFQMLIRMMKDSEFHTDANSALNYHITLVQLLANCTEGKNVTTEMKCISLLTLDDIVRVVTHPDCTAKVLTHFGLWLNSLK